MPIYRQRQVPASSLIPQWDAIRGGSHCHRRFYPIYPFLCLDSKGFSLSELNLPPELVFKVYDRRFAYGFRELYKVKPPTYESELAYHEYVQSGNAPNGLDAIIAERNAHYLSKIPSPP